MSNTESTVMTMSYDDATYNEAFTLHENMI